MDPVTIRIVYAGRDKERDPVETILSHVRIVTRALSRDGIQPTIEHIDVLAAEFSMADFIESSRQSRAVIVLMITPALLTDDIVGGHMEKLLGGDECLVLPVYCKRVPNADSLPWSGRCGLPHAIKGEWKPAADWRNLDEAGAAIAEGLRHVVRKHARPVESQASDERPARRETRPRIEHVGSVGVYEGEKQPGTKAGGDPHQRKVPPLAVFCASSDRSDVEVALTPILHALQENRNVRAFAPWTIKSGANRDVVISLAQRSPNLVVILSADATANDDIVKLLRERRPDQKLTLVYLRSCMWDLLPVGEHTMLPIHDSEPFPITSRKERDKYWTQLGRHLLSLFPTALPAESEELTADEQAIQGELERKSAERQRSESQRRRDPDYDIVTAYYNK